MKKLGEQWVETIDGEEHMMKAVERHSEKTHNCSGCFYNDHTGKCLYGQDCPIADVEHGYIKDLGILRDGVLPCPFYGEYPEINILDGGGKTIWYRIAIYGNPYIEIEESMSLQKAIDAWNRRA